jgi:hypothetical protein
MSRENSLALQGKRKKFGLIRQYGGKRVKVAQLGHGNFNKPSFIGT